MSFSVEPISDVVSKWGEGPVWNQDHLLYVDIAGHQIHRFHPKTGQTETWNVGERVGTVVPRQKGGFVYAGDHGISFYDPETSLRTAIIDPEPDKKPQNRFNDGKCDPSGRFFAGTISLVKKTGDAKLYRLDPDLSLHEIYSPVTTSNGLVWDLKKKLFYYIDTPTRQVLAFDYEAETGAISNPRPVVQTGHIDASPDGMALDVLGNLWIAFCHGACVAAFDPETGKEIERINLPCLETTAVAFGGDDMGDLYITTGIHSSIEEPLAGRLFVTRPGVQGVGFHPFAG